MPMDGITIGAVVFELQSRLSGGRVEKITQPEKDEIILQIRSGGENHRLLLSASASHARLHLTNTVKKNPEQAPLFCMLLRKHLSGGKVTDILQQGNERITEIRIESMDELGEYTVKTLILELMGKHSNLMLVKDGIIVDSIKRVTPEISRVRQVLPGLPYQAPPGQGKLDPLFHEPTSDFESILANEKNISPSRLLTDHFLGLSAAAAKEITFRGEKSSLREAFFAYRQRVLSHDFAPCLLLDPWGVPIDFFPFPYTMLEASRLQGYPSMSQAMEQYFALRDKALRIKERSRELHAKLQTLLERCEKKRALQLEKLQECEKAEELRIFGELLQANLYQIKKGASSATVANYYLPDSPPLAIPLEPRLSPAANAQRYFKQYSKLKTAASLINRQIAENDEELAYLQSQLENLDKCTEYEELQEIRQELILLGYISSTPSKKGEKLPESKPMRFRSPDGIDIYVGKNNAQNDRLTLHFATPENLWLHTKDIPGSHVIVRYDGQPPQATLQAAAMLAAYYSKGRTSANVPVDTALRKYVKKPSGALPGKVIFTNNVTLFVTPQEEAVRSLERVE